MDYEDVTDSFHISRVAPFRAYTKFENPKIYNYLVYHQTIRNNQTESLGFPQIVSIGSWYTFRDLSDLTYKTAMRLCTNNSKTDNSPVFKIKVLEISTLKCGLCKKCDGCPIPNDYTELKTIENICIGIE